MRTALGFDVGDGIISLAGAPSNNGANGNCAFKPGRLSFNAFLKYDLSSLKSVFYYHLYRNN